MSDSTDRLGLASDVQSVARLGRGRSTEKLEGPAATLLGGGQSACDAETRDLTTLTRCDANGSADMAESTRTRGLSDSGSPTVTVKITPVTLRRSPVTTTPTVA